uniref:Kelch domain-containing protein 10 n=1 Tax=Angiostrongylus costaricensis TaxID=334426 RepID=A0A158PKZ1_ANGCS
LSFRIVHSKCRLANVIYISFLGEIPCFWYYKKPHLWTVALEGGPRRVNHAAVAIGDRIFSFGGYCSGETVDPDQSIDIHMLDTSEFLSYLFERLPYQRYGHTVCAYRGRAYLWGGRNDDYGASSILHEFDPVLLRWRIVPVEGRVPPSRDGHSAVVVGDRMYLFGGFEEDLQRFSQETYVFDFLTNRWSELNTSGQPPLWRDFHTAVAIDSKMYIFGGRSDHTGQFHSTRDMYDERLKALDLRTGEWSDPICSGIGPTGRRSHSAWTYGGKMYIFGGYLGTQNMHYDDLFSFDPSTNHWEKIKTSGQMPSARRRQCTVVVDSRVFLFGGTMWVDVLLQLLFSPFVSLTSFCKNIFVAIWFVPRKIGFMWWQSLKSC